MDSVVYRLRIATGRKPFAGTDASVSVRLFGSLGDSGKVRLATQKSDMEMGDQDSYDVSSPFDLGRLTSLWIGHDNSGRGAGWFLEGVDVVNSATKQAWTFPCRRWLAVDEEDGQIERTLAVAPPANPPAKTDGPMCSFFKQEGVSRPTGGTFELVSISKYFWDNGSTIRIHFLNGTEDNKKAAEAAASEWLKYANLKFQFFYDPAQPPLDSEGHLGADIGIEFWDKNEGNSVYGTTSRLDARKGHSSMRLPSKFSRVVTIHEFGHALGLAHEQQNPNAKIPWNKPAVYDYYQKNYGWDQKKVDDNLFEKLDQTSINFSTFDSKSIMLYYIPKSFTTDGSDYPVNLELSDADKKGIAQIYPAAQRCPKCRGVGITLEAAPTLPGGVTPTVGFKPVTCSQCQGSGHL